MVEIPEYKRDERKDPLFILEGLNELPFPVGKDVLVYFLKGIEENRIIEKNKLFELKNFGNLNYLHENKIYELIDSLLEKGFISESFGVLDKSKKVLTISQQGEKEIFNHEGIDKGEFIGENTKFLEELNKFLIGLNPEQKKAVILGKKKILCVAGAGSGKTTVLTKRIEFLAKFKRVKGDKILAITFTRKAKEEMEKRLLKSGVKVIVETFNSFCEKILLKYGNKIYGKRVRIANFEDKMVCVLRALENMNLSLKEGVTRYFKESSKYGEDSYLLQKLFVSDCFQIFEEFKLSKLSLEEFRKRYFESDEVSKMVFEIVRFTQEYFSNFGLRTYADQVEDAVNFLKMYPKFIPHFEHILVDEFQDVNKIQTEILEILNPENLFLVGDPRQSIFGWRGGELNQILNFEEKNPDSETIQMTKNYRSSKSIVEFINKSIKEMNLPDLEGNKIENSKIELFSFSSEEEEFDFMINKILSLEVEREEIFVLARTNRELQKFSEILEKKGINHVLKTEGKREVSIKKGEITLSTIHSIKGLEGEAVFLFGCTPKNFPPRYSEHPILDKVRFYNYNKLEEERRLFYVALSRAKKYLYLTYSGKKHTDFITDEMKRMLLEN